MRFDLAVVGTGPAGYAAAVRAFDLGKRVLVVEKADVGGAGIHRGALSSKTMWHLAHDYACARRTDRGYRAERIELSFSDVMRVVATAVAEKRTALERQLDELAKTGRLTFVRGFARFLSPTEIAVDRGASTERYLADHTLVATGSVPRVPEGIVVDGEWVLTSDHIESLPDFPESLVVVGAGVIGCEYATIFAMFGRTRVRIIDRQPRILPFEDEDVARVVADNFRELGIVVHDESRLEALERRPEGVRYVLCDRNGNTCAPHDVERALVAIGRVPNTQGLGLEAIGVQLDAARGIVACDTQTSVPNIYAAGDVTMDIALANVAELEGRHAVEKMFNANPRPIHYEAMSAIMFLSPEVASVGLNETQAKKKGIRYRVGVVSHRLVNRSIAMRAARGFIKLLADPSGKILGLRAVGPHASSAAQGVAFLIDQRATLDDIDRCVHPHPAVTEGVQEAARLLLGKSVLKPSVFGDELLRVGEG